MKTYTVTDLRNNQKYHTVSNSYSKLLLFLRKGTMNPYTLQKSTPNLTYYVDIQRSLK